MNNKGLQKPLIKIKNKKDKQCSTMTSIPGLGLNMDPSFHSSLSQQSQLALIRSLDSMAFIRDPEQDRFEGFGISKADRDGS